MTRPLSAGVADTSATAFLALVSGRRGHFRLESGHHGGLWLDLDPLFADAPRIEPFVQALVERVEAYDVSIVCGPLVGGAFLALLIAQTLGVEFAYTERFVPPSRDGLYQVEYRLPAGRASLVRGKRVAMVDDVMSAGSALRGTFRALAAQGAEPVAAGALMVLGDRGAKWFAEQGVVVEAVARDDYDMWTPAECPLCRTGVPLEDVATPRPHTE
jgi:orotate phosphoribosyltransferase